MKITLVQATVQDTVTANLDHIEELLHPSPRTDLIVLGEMFVAPYQHDKFKTNAIERGDPSFERIRAIARRHDVWLVAGSIPERDGEQLYNTTFVFDSRGQVVARYRKIHRFAVTYPDGRTFREHDTIAAGDELVVVPTPFGTIGLMICFDIRFPQLAHRLRTMGADVLVVPGAFNDYTGPLHWRLAFQSRAVDNQLYVVGVSPAADSFGDYAYYGHSIVVDPLGRIRFEADGEETVRTVEVDLAEIADIRRTLPIIANETNLPE